MISRDKLTKDSPATGKQLHTIAVLCHVLGIKSNLEDSSMTFGSAGRLYRELKAEQRLRRIEERSRKVRSGRSK